MSYELSPKLVNIGFSPNDGQGDNLRAAFTKINETFAAIYSRDAVGSNVSITGNKITALNTGGNLVLEPNGNGVISVSNKRIADVALPSSNTDAANKQYVDSAVQTITSIIGGVGALEDILSPATTTSNGYMTPVYVQKLMGIEEGATADMTASEILVSLKTVDGLGSGLDAELLGGKPYSDYATQTDLQNEGNLRTLGDQNSINTAKIYTNDTVGNLVGTAPSTLNTLWKIAAAIGNNATYSTTVSNALDSKLSKSSNLGDLGNVVIAKTNLGLSTVASTGSYTDLTNKPVNVSAFTNDTGFVTVAGARGAIGQGTGIVYNKTTGIISADTAVMATKQYVDNSITGVTAGVSSVNGINGVVTLTTDNINEGAINLYYTPNRVRSALSFAAGSGAYNNTTGLITIPTDTNQLTNTANFLKPFTLTLNGDLTGNVSVDNTSAALTITARVAANSVALGTDTTGNYVANVAQGNGVTVTGTAGEGATFTVGHAATSTQANVEATSNTFVSGVTFDAFGHVTGVVTGSPTDTLESVTLRGAVTSSALTVNNTTASTSTTTGAIKVVGGVGIGGNIYVGGIMNGTATSARYADLAEVYTSDAEYAPGTVLVFGGEYEVTISTKSHDSAVAGIVSTDPAYLMNSMSQGVPVALSGKVPCRVQGPVKKGDVLVTSYIPGVATKLVQFVPGCVVGKAMENITTYDIETINVAVGRF